MGETCKMRTALKNTIQHAVKLIRRVVNVVVLSLIKEASKDNPANAV